MARRVCTNAVALATEVLLFLGALAAHVLVFLWLPIGACVSYPERVSAALQALLATWTLSSAALLCGPVSAAKKYALCVLSLAHGAGLLYCAYASAAILDALSMRAGLATAGLALDTFAWVLRLQLVCLSRADRRSLGVPFYAREDKPRLYLLPHA